MLRHLIGTVRRCPREPGRIALHYGAPDRPVTRLVGGPSSWMWGRLNGGISSSVATSIDVFGDLFADPVTNEAIETYRARPRAAE